MARKIELVMPQVGKELQGDKIFAGGIYSNLPHFIYTLPHPKICCDHHQLCNHLASYLCFFFTAVYSYKPLPNFVGNGLAGQTPTDSKLEKVW